VDVAKGEDEDEGDEIEIVVIAELESCNCNLRRESNEFETAAEVGSEGEEPVLGSFGELDDTFALGGRGGRGFSPTPIVLCNGLRDYQISGTTTSQHNTPINTRSR